MHTESWATSILRPRDFSMRRRFLWWLWWVLVTAIGWGIGTLAAWETEVHVVNLLEARPESVSLSDLRPNIAVSGIVFGTVVGVAQLIFLNKALPAVTAPRWIFATSVGWTIMSLEQWSLPAPVWETLGGLLQWRTLRPGMPWSIIWVVGTTATRWLVSMGIFQEVRESFAVVGGPVAIACMGVTLGIVYGAITGVVLVLLVQSPENCMSAVAEESDSD